MDRAHIGDFVTPGHVVALVERLDRLIGALLARGATPEVRADLAARIKHLHEQIEAAGE